MDLSVLLVRPDDADVVALSTVFGSENPLDSRLGAGQECVADIGWDDDDSSAFESVVGFFGVLGDAGNGAWSGYNMGSHCGD